MQTLVTLADGRTVQALVPQVYVHVQPGDLRGDGALVAGQQVKLDVTGDALNQGSIAGRELVQLSAANISSNFGRIEADQSSTQACPHG